MAEIESHKNDSAFGYYTGCFKNYAKFSGRARRSEYWYFILFSFLIALGICFVGGMFGDGGLLVDIYQLAVLIPGLAVFFRRLHDTGRSGWWWLLGLIPVIGWIVLLIFACQDSQPGENEYGPNPKS